MKTTILPAILIVALGMALGLRYNDLRTDRRIDLGRNYFVVSPRSEMAPPSITGEAAERDDRDSFDTRRSERPPADPPSTAQANDNGADSLLPNNPFKAVSLTQMADYVRDSSYGSAIVVIDARDAQHYAEGHIPGAFHVDNYNIEKTIDAVLPYIMAADVVIAYCNGGDCEDSIFLASHLNAALGVPHEKLHVFEGGIKAWTAEGYDVETGGMP